MRWFKKLFKGKSGKHLDKPSSSKADPWLNKLQKKRDSEASTSKLPTTEVYALTTVRNFHCDSLDAFVLESEWVFLSKEQLMEPKFQYRLARSDTLTDLCKRLAERQVRMEATVVAKPPYCHCAQLCPKESETKKVNPFRKFANAITRFWKRLCKKLFCCVSSAEMESDSVPKEEMFQASDFTQSYLCR